MPKKSSNSPVHTPSKDERDTKQCESCKSLIETVCKLTEEVASLKKTVEVLTTAAEEQKAKEQQDIRGRLRAIEEKIEERTNRQLRKTLVVRGVPENDKEKTWEDTENVFTKKIAETIDVTTDEAKEMIERCHRGGNPSKFRDMRKERPIFVALHSWKRCEEIVSKARKTKSLMVDFKYGPITTARRNMALKPRRELLDSGSLVKAHISYPAKLMGKGLNDIKYKLIEDFSKIEIDF